MLTQPIKIALLLSAVLVALVSTTGALLADKRPPNFVVIFTDDQGYQDVGCFGSPDIRTPRLDAMAAQGMKFTDFYAQPICGPSRAALMTGCYPLRVAERGNVKQVHPILHSEEITVAEVLKGEGYATACFGKWDLAKHSQQTFYKDLFPTHQGFDYFFGTPTSNDSIANLYRNDELIEPKTEMATLTKRYTDEAIGFMRKHKDQPFFVYLPHSMPHTRLDATEQFKGKSKRGLYGDVIEELDFNIGRILDEVEELKLADNTYVLFTSDNGPWLIKNKNLADGHLPSDHGGSAGLLRSGKVSTFEGGLRVPTILWGPGRVPAGTTCSSIASTLDVLPTLAHLAGAKVPQDRVIDGERIDHLFRGDFESADADKAFYYYLRVHLQAVRQGKWKLHLPRKAQPVGVAPFNPNRHIAPADRIGFDEPFLVDLEKDIGETTNVADRNPKVVERLLALAETMREDLGDFDRVGENMRFFDPVEQRPSRPPVPVAKRPRQKPKSQPASKPKAKSTAVKSRLQVSPLFTDHMVLQQGMAVPVWGKAGPGQTVTVKFAGQRQTTQADEQGNWRTSLTPLKATNKGQVLVVESDGDKRESSDVVVGEVWVCSGQSNMQYSMNQTEDGKLAIAPANHPLIRIFQRTPGERTAEHWQACTPDNVAGFSAVAYFFGRHLHEKQNTPVGLIVRAVGGTTIQRWASPRHWRENALIDKLAEEAIQRSDEFAKLEVEKNKYDKRNKPPGDKARWIAEMTNLAYYRNVGGLYERMIKPLQPLAIRGVIWYQGEFNNRNRQAFEYREWQENLVDGWREDWGQGDFPFLFVQMQGLGNQTTAVLRESQATTLKRCVNTAMAVICDESVGLHPVKKQVAGDRLAIAALGLVYDAPHAPMGPSLQSFEITKGKAVLTFNQVDDGLVCNDNQLVGFFIAGADKRFRVAQAAITAPNQITVSCDEIAEPVAVRYAWLNTPRGQMNLFNSFGLPASPFRTDSWSNTGSLHDLLPTQKPVRKKASNPHKM